MMANYQIVAVYGTLREGLNDHTLLSTGRRIGMGWLTGFSMHDLGGSPAIVPAHENTERIRVEWYKIPDTTLEELDRLEGYDPNNAETSVFLRKRVFSPYGKGWIYVYNQPLKHAPYMEAGDWVRFSQLSTLIPAH
ncbi:gamma-glutamylcyclotransferase family protein [Marinomonas algarum]|uniref:Gamma-glutamylcyclotransferase n=1 Tax=Marinomonas algarum TaxID=2883105 RepID=A0A9X1IQ18_9GAMM|nr:gamma-glutamylcyclotransferase family protein [Marinomonas algarum]MCB5162351.1 gamma-glutamylcyclotransferase [Marinomonas algarum]